MVTYIRQFAAHDRMEGRDEVLIRFGHECTNSRDLTENSANLLHCDSGPVAQKDRAAVS